MTTLHRTDYVLHLECTQTQACALIPDFCTGVAEAKLWLAGAREGVPCNAAEASRLKVLWINGTHTCKDIKPQ